MEPELQAQMFEFGPLHKYRYDITDEIIKLPVQTGDILFRSSNAKGPLGLPFSKIVAWLSHSKYSHAAIFIIERYNNIDWPYVFEINDQGTIKYRFIDWLDMEYKGDFRIYRLKGADPNIVNQLETEIKKALLEDPDYDFTFSDPAKFYCVESVADIYKKIGIDIIEPECIKDIVPWWVYYVIYVGNWFFSFFGTTIPLDKPLYYVGNEKRGMMSSDKLELIYEYDLTQNKAKSHTE